MSEELDLLLNDPLFLRLRKIRQDVETGRADPETVKRWETLRETLAAITDHLRTTLLSAPPKERERAARNWIQAFADKPWPEPTVH